MAANVSIQGQHVKVKGYFDKGILTTVLISRLLATTNLSHCFAHGWRVWVNFTLR